MRTHRLKTLATYFQLSAMGLKPYEIRLNDRLYQQGDIVELYCIQKTNRADIEVMRNDGRYINWPKYDPADTWRDPTLDMALAGKHVPLDSMSPQSRAQLACIRATVLFVLPGTDDIGMHSDHVLLTLQQIEYTGPTYLSGNRPPNWANEPSMFDILNAGNQTKPQPKAETLTAEQTIAGLKGAGFEKEYRGSNSPIPEGVFWDWLEHGFYNTNGGSMGLSFKNKWLDRKDEFPQVNNPVKPEPQGTTLEGVPDNIYWNPESGNFYHTDNNKGQGQAFFDKWFDRRDEFPNVIPELVKKTKGDGKSLLREATAAPVEGVSDAKGYKPKGFA